MTSRPSHVVVGENDEQRPQLARENLGRTIGDVLSLLAGKVDREFLNGLDEVITEHPLALGLRGWCQLENGTG